MKRKSHYTVACLSGDGIGPELMAEASRALAEAGRLHGFRVDEVHAPFAGEAVSRHGHPLPPATRAACRQADAVLVALTREPALEGVKAELDLTWRVQRVRLPDGDLAIVSPLTDDVEAFAVAQAFELARARRARVTAVGEGRAWEVVVGHAPPVLRDRHAGGLRGGRVRPRHSLAERLADRCLRAALPDRAGRFRTDTRVRA